MKEANKSGGRVVRKRQNRVEVYLNDEELKLLDELSGFCHHDRSKTIRHLIRLKVPVQAPPMEVTELTRQLRAVGNNLNQLAAKAHALDYVDEPVYRDNAITVFRLCGEIREAFAKGGVDLGCHKNMAGKKSSR